VKLSDEELSRWICNKEEPESSLSEVVWTKTQSSSFPSRANVRPGELSPRGYWKIGPGMKWKRRDMVHDAQMTVMLLSRLALQQIVALDICDDGSTGILNAQLELITEAPSLGRAVAEAWALANGFQEAR
jgi:hypothetical protein